MANDAALPDGCGDQENPIPVSAGEGERGSCSGAGAPRHPLRIVPFAAFRSIPGRHLPRGDGYSEVDMPTYVVIAIAIVSVVLLRLLLDRLDRERIAAYVRDRRGEVLSCRWAPFSKGWLGENGERIYEVRYRTRDGDHRRATVKTSMLTGVYLTHDRHTIDAAAIRSRADETAPDR